MTIKLIASDLDGTLLDEHGGISERTKEAIRRAEKKGVLFTFATGRMYRSALPFAQELNLDLPLITYEGALIKTSHTQEVIRHRPLPVDLAKEIITIGDQEHLSVNVYVDDEIYVHRETEAVQDYSRMVRVPYTKVDHLQSFLEQPPTKVIYIGEEERLLRLWGELKEQFGDQAYITKSTPHFLEFTHPQATKGNGIQVLSQILNIKQEEIMAFGDNFNDLSLLSSAGLAVAMENGREELKKEADFVTSSNREDGVAQAIEQFVLSE
ncbi:Cof-type HAD-IIB family hydrolase [Dehalobacterium formicoaceticum]|uniref:Cof-type HAD-IIB family hydrolase n=1 Tax=Dehalobacterium formicoaceticum TaxID=51515 RepID=A0ABT1Y3A2_9FIRM|nr:Cof-type HAD-IIB family hydrolase [Dehalobacterium formicoaceticum]MCR6545360.1 Cof-type HAD-IIB family hydrolase [Dehalobacterium formicoaceticum]